MERLRPHAKKLVCVDLNSSGFASTSRRWTPAADGASSSTEEAANVTLRIKPADLPLIAQRAETCSGLCENRRRRGFCQHAVEFELRFTLAS